MKRRLRRQYVYILAKAARALFFLLPFNCAVFLGGLLGGAAFFLLPRWRIFTIQNLKFAFGQDKAESQIVAIAKGVFVNFGRSLAEFVSLPKISNSSIESIVSACGLEKIDNALKDGRGVIMLASHLGNWELLAAYFGLKGYPTNVLARPLRDRRIEHYVNSVRRTKNISVLTRGGGSFKKIISVLKNNQLIGMLPDQDIEKIDGVFVDFFNRKAHTPIGPVVLALASGAPIFPIFCIRQASGRHRLIVEDKLDLEVSGDRQKDIYRNTQKWSGLVERYIRENPDQWVWFHKRWKTQQKDI